MNTVVAKKRKQKHLGVRVPPEVEELLTALVEHMRQEAGPAARVSESSVVLALIVQEVEKKGLKKKR